MNKRKTFLTLALTAVCAGGAFLANGVFAADHAEAPLAGADPAADIADFYAWHTADDTVVAVITFAGAGADSPTYDNETLYTFHFDTDDDAVSDIDVHARFGTNGEGDWGLQVTNLPGASGVVEGDVDTALTDGTATAWAGPADDPFFFDLDGYLATLDSGSLSFTAVDFFAGLNVTAIVIEFDLAELGSDTFQTWATTGRL